MKTANLSERIRPNSEAAPWVCDEVAALEIERDRLKAALHSIILAEADSTTSAPDKVRDMARIARAATTTPVADSVSSKPRYSERDTVNKPAKKP